MINPIWLRTFNKLVEIGHFTRTAEILHMTQSGVSQHIQKLEAHLDIELMVKHGKKFSLTEAGERLYSVSQKIVRGLTELDEIIRIDSAYIGAINIMSPGSVGLKIYEHLLSMQIQHPKLTMNYRFGPNKDVESAVVAHNIEIGLMTKLAEHPALENTLISTERLMVVTPSSVSNISWKVLNTLGFIDHPDGAHHAKLLLGANYPEFQQISMFEKKGFSNQISLILEPVSKGLGFTVLPSFAVDAFSKPDLISVFSLSKVVDEKIYLVKHKDKPLSKRLINVVEEIKARLEHK